MPLIVEVWDERKSCWEEQSQIVPGELEGSITSFSIAGGWEVFRFGCMPDDSCSKVVKSTAGIEIEGPDDLRLVATPPGALVEVAELRDGEAHEMPVLTEGMLVATKLRFFHRKIDFGAKVCPLCNEAIPTQQFTGHAFAHGPYEMQEWPGGTAAFIKFLRETLDESIRRAKGFPRVQDALKAVLSDVNMTQQRHNASMN